MKSKFKNEEELKESLNGMLSGLQKTLKDIKQMQETLDASLTEKEKEVVDAFNEEAAKLNGDKEALMKLKNKYLGELNNGNN